MSYPVEVRFRNMESSDALDARVKQHAEKLQQFYDQIIGCNVTIEVPHHHQHRGYRYLVRIRISVPGNVIVVSHENEKDDTHEDPYIAVRDAFDSARRQLQDYARIRRNKVKSHEPSPKREFVNELADSEESDR